MISKSTTNDREQLERFRALLLAAMNLFRETRRDIAKLQIQVVALKSALATAEPLWEEHFREILKEVEKKIAAQNTPDDIELEKQLDDLILLISSDNDRVQ